MFKILIIFLCITSLVFANPAIRLLSPKKSKISKMIKKKKIRKKSFAKYGILKNKIARC